MKNGVYSLTTLVVVAAAACFVLRQRALSEIRSANESLREQVKTQGGGARPEVAAEVYSTNSALPLSAEERNERLRLRGQISSLHSEATAASNRVAVLIQSRPAPGPGQKTSTAAEKNREAFREFTASPYFQSAHQLAQAVRAYRAQHGGKTPENLSAVTVPDTDAFSENIVGRFELIRNSGPISEDPEIASFVLIAHEKDAVQLPDGNWVRLYILANGGLSIVGPLPNKPPSDDSNFIRQMEETVKRKTQAKQAEPRR
jgi:hypothetical protein